MMLAPRRIVVTSLAAQDDGWVPACAPGGSQPSPPKASRSTSTTFARAIEGSDADALVAIYADDAAIDMINQNSPPANPHRLRGKAEISRYFADVRGRAMTHAIERRVQPGESGAFVERCTYPDGFGVLSVSVSETQGGRIMRQATVGAWDS